MASGPTTYVPDIASLARGFPPELPVPELLRDFATWLAERPRSSLGLFHLESEPLAASFAADDDATAALRARLGIFLTLPPATHLALWARPAVEPAVVSLSPSARLAIAPDLATFLIALSRAETGIAALDRDPDNPSRAALATWLAARGVGPSAQDIEPESFAHWFDATIREAKARRSSPLPAAALPPDLWSRADPLIGRLTTDPSVQQFFAGIGFELSELRDPTVLRSLSRPADGVVFSIVWPWEHPSEWRDIEYPKAVRPTLERERMRMLWSLELLVVPQTRDGRAFKPYRGGLPFGIDATDDVDRLEVKLGSPILGRYGSRTWDFPAERRTLVAGLNEGALIRDDIPRGALMWLRWHFRQSS